MEQTGSLKSLAERMKEKAEQERMETEKVFTEQLQTLKDSLQASPQNALSTMLDAMPREVMGARQRLGEQYKILSLAFGRKWIVLASLGAALCLGMLAGGWALAKAGAWRLESYRSELAQLEQDCREQSETLAILKSEAWNLELQELSNGRFIVFPPGKKPDGRVWTVDGRAAIKMEE